MARWAKAKTQVIIHEQTTEPDANDGVTLGDIWVDTSSGAELKVCSNTSPITFDAVGGSSSPLTTKGDVYTYTTTDARLAVGTDDMVLMADSSASSGLSYNYAMPNFHPEKRVVYFTDLYTNQISSTANEFGWGGATTGGTISDVSNDYLDGTHWGVRELSTSTSSTGLASIYFFSDSTSTYMKHPDGGQLLLKTSMKLSHTATTSEDFICKFGLLRSQSGVPDGNYFYHREEKGANWICATNGTSDVTETDSGVAVDTNWNRFLIVINADATEVKFYINDSLVATNTTNIYTGNAASQDVIPMASIQKTIGTTARTVDVDYCAMLKDFTTAR